MERWRGGSGEGGGGEGGGGEGGGEEGGGGEGGGGEAEGCAKTFKLIHKPLWTALKWRRY